MTSNTPSNDTDSDSTTSWTTACPTPSLTTNDLPSLDYSLQSQQLSQSIPKTDWVAAWEAAWEDYDALKALQLQATNELESTKLDLINVLKRYRSDLEDHLDLKDQHVNLIEEMIKLRAEVVMERSEHGKTMEECGIKGVKHREETREAREKLKEREEVE